MSTKAGKAAAKKPGRKAKALSDYLCAPPGTPRTLADYLANPATAFLRQVCELHDAFEHCKNKFTKKLDGTYNSDSADSLHQISVSLVATAMGHFETYQKSLFAGLFERSRHFPEFDPKAFEKAVNHPSIDISRLAAYRGLSAPVGLTIADSLSAWHSPGAVNAHFAALGIKQQLFSGSEVRDLQVLWQLRHSIVHTGVFLTRPDAQKVRELRNFGDQSIAFELQFVNAFARRIHKVVKAATGRTKSGASSALGASPDPSVVTDLTAFLSVSSPKPTWL